MATFHWGVVRKHVTSIMSFMVISIAPSGVMRGQSHPFAAPAPIISFSLTSKSGLVDVNRDGSPDVVTAGFFGGTLVTTLDENGAALSTNGTGPTVTPQSSALWPTSIGMAGGVIDGDDLEDFITIVADGTVRYHRNQGATVLGPSNFAVDVVVDNFSSAYPVSPPFVNYVFSVVEIVDLDADGLQDVLIAGGPRDRWTGNTLPGFVAFYKGDGAGGFTVSRYSIPGTVVDVEFADLDNDGTRDCLVVLVETGLSGVFGYELVHVAVANGSLSGLGLSQNVGPGRMTALEMADVVGDGNSDYILAQVGMFAGSAASQVYYFEGDGQGGVSSSSWGTFALPANLTGLGDFISSIQVGDFNRDSHMDIAILRGFVTASAAFSSNLPIRADSEVLVAMGPSVVAVPAQVIALPGYTTFSSVASHLFPLMSLAAEPDGLRPIDFGKDSSMDLLVVGVRVVTTSTQPLIVTIKNLTPPVLGDACFAKVGEPSGGVVSRPARIGFEGGRPRPGNSNFACTIQNTQGGCLVGLMWSTYGFENLFSVHGIQFHLAPEDFGYAAVTSGSSVQDGFHSYPLPIPNVPALIGDAGYFQYNYYDPVTDSFGGTQATWLWIGT